MNNLDNEMVFSEISREESELGLQLVTELSKSMPYGQAVMMVSEYACEIENRLVSHKMMS